MIFGSYGQSIHETNPTNTTMPRTLGVIYLQALYKLQGWFEVMSLLTGKIIYHRRVVHIPITQEVIDRVKTLYNKEVIKSQLTFKDRKKGTIHEDDDENGYGYNSIAGVDDEDEE